MAAFILMLGVVLIEETLTRDIGQVRTDQWIEEVLVLVN